VTVDGEVDLLTAPLNVEASLEECKLRISGT